MIEKRILAKYGREGGNSQSYGKKLSQSGIIIA